VFCLSLATWIISRQGGMTNISKDKILGIGLGTTCCAFLWTALDGSQNINPEQMIYQILYCIEV
jgi:hypothetical protein